MTHKELIIAIGYKTGYKIEVVGRIIEARIDVSTKRQKRAIQFRHFGTLRYACICDNA